MIEEGCSEDWCAHPHYSTALECVDGELDDKGVGTCEGGLFTATGVNLNDHMSKGYAPSA